MSKYVKPNHLSCLASPKDVGQIREAPKISNIYLGVMFLACIENNVQKKEGKCGNNWMVKGRLGIKLTAVGLIFWANTMGAPQEQFTSSASGRNFNQRCPNHRIATMRSHWTHLTERLPLRDFWGFIARFLYVCSFLPIMGYLKIYAASCVYIYI